MNRVINSFINTVKKIKSEIFGKIADFICLHVEKIKSEILVPFGHRTKLCNKPLTLAHRLHLLTTP